MKLIIQIPCFNEEEYLPVTLAQLPQSVEGVDIVEYLVIDDGSTDDSIKIARENGAHHILALPAHLGLAGVFMAGIERCLELGADIIVNTDADNQYNAQDIVRLIKPIVDGKAGMVIGIRPVQEIEHFSFTKKLLHCIGSKFISHVTNLDIKDAPSGFRAISAEAARRLNIFSEYTYTLESIIQARFNNIKIETVPVRVNSKLRESRLIKSTPSYVMKSIKTIFRILIIYNPSWFFNRLSLFFFTAGLLLGIRFLYFYFTDGGKGHIQSLILVSIFFMLGLGSVLIKIFADLISMNRRLLEDVRYRLKKTEYKNN